MTEQHGALGDVALHRPSAYHSKSLTRMWGWRPDVNLLSTSCACVHTCFLPAAERTGLCLAHVTHICGYACGYAPDIWLLGALALRYDYTDTIQSSSV